MTMQKRYFAIAALTVALLANVYEAQAIYIGGGHGGIGFGVSTGPSYVNTYDYDDDVYTGTDCRTQCLVNYGIQLSSGAYRCGTACSNCRANCAGVVYTEPAYVTPRVGIGFGGGWGHRWGRGYGRGYGHRYGRGYGVHHGGHRGGGHHRRR